MIEWENFGYNSVEEMFQNFPMEGGIILHIIDWECCLVNVPHDY